MVFHRTLRQALDALPDGKLHCVLDGTPGDPDPTVEVLATRLPDDFYPDLTRNLSRMRSEPDYEWVDIGGDDRLPILTHAMPAPSSEQALDQAVAAYRELLCVATV